MGLGTGFDTAVNNTHNNNIMHVHGSHKTLIIPLQVASLAISLECFIEQIFCVPL